MTYRIDKQTSLALSNWRTLGWAAVSVAGFVTQGACVGVMIMFAMLFVFGRPRPEWELVETNTNTTLDSFNDVKLARAVYNSLREDLRKGNAPKPHEIGFDSYYKRKRQKLEQNVEARKIIDQWNQSSLSS